MTRKVLLLLLTVIVAGSSAGSILAMAGVSVPGFSRSASPRDTLPALTRVNDGESRRVAEFANLPGATRAVFTSLSPDGKLVCIWDTHLLTGERGGGCNPASDPFAGGHLMMSLSFDGGPSLGSVTSARVIGIGSPDVMGVKVILKNGDVEDVDLSHDRAFGVSFNADDLAVGRSPVEVIAVDADGTALDRETTFVG